MNTDLLTLTQWLSPAFPLGSFAYSHGLETAIASGDVTDAQTLQAWLRVVLTQGTGIVDATLLCRTMEGQDLGNVARALAASRERLEEAEAQGAAFVDTVNKITGDAQAVAPLPVAVGVAARSLSLSTEDVAALYLHAFISNLVSAAVRFVPLGQSAGQAVLSALHADIAETARRAVTMTLDDLGAAAPGADMAAMKHETQDVRIFKT
ncbi:urease accessory protein UreF [Actibacterium mucosum KCTC 23349]|uniref:Urease accessory protein UreF n=1 Tax=Actibacterium mucosum KCTC 23349 TaxID=1454373 RepID=A0A037ZH96_9RHOB|nr:urease accessory UreF family protein [Actibacterium mucosum]KAJ55503.1 urease accessory protein UreF [Actibacterium mucosum KCTC 23349]